MAITPFDSYLVNFDEALVDFCDEFKTKYKIMWRITRGLRLYQEWKLREANECKCIRFPLNIECFMNDLDVSSINEQAQFEQLCSPSWPGLNHLKAVMEQANLMREDISSKK